MLEKEGDASGISYVGMRSHKTLVTKELSNHLPYGNSQQRYLFLFNKKQVTYEIHSYGCVKPTAMDVLQWRILSAGVRLVAER